MQAETERDELRALQRKAYGPEGGLTDAEARRLRELEAAGRGGDAPAVPPPPAEPPPVEVGDQRLPVTSGIPGMVADSASTITGTADERAQSPAPAPEAPRTGIPLRHRRWVLAAASVLLLLVGVGAGWALFGQRPETVSLTAEQQERRLELYAEADFDEGSLQAVAEEEDALVWYGTRSGGEQACLVIDIAQASSQACQDADDVDSFGISASVMVPRNAGSDAESGVAPGSSVNATMMLSTSGQPMVSIQRWSSDLAMIGQFQGPERDRAAELVEYGFTAGLLLVGDFLSEPVWLGTRFVEGDRFIEYCMIVDGAQGRTACTSDFDVSSRGISTDIDGEVDGMPTSWNLRVQNTQNQTPYLTIAQTLAFPNPGDRMELGGEHGDPIEVTIPSEPEG